MLIRRGSASIAALGMGHAPNRPGTQKCIKRKYHMRNKFITALLVSVAAGATSAQVIGSSGSDTNELLSDPAPTLVAASSGDLTNSVLAAASINEQGISDLEPVLREPLVPSRLLSPSDAMAVDGGVGWSFVLPDGIQAQRDVLFRKLDQLLRAKTRGSPVIFGIDRELKFVDLQTNQPGIPAPLGFAYPLPEQRLEFFGELAPIFDPAPATTMGWGAGIGIRLNFGR